LGWSLSEVDKAKLGQGCENHYIGAQTGLMDQLTSLCGKAGHLVLSEYRDVQVAHVDFPKDWVWVVADSGVKHDLREEYNVRRAQCEESVRLFRAIDPNIRALRDVSSAFWDQYQDSLPETVRRRAAHVIGENQRVLQAKALLKQGDIEAFGALLFASHRSSQHNFENSCPALDILVQLAEASEQCVGARLSGGGFGGITIHLVRRTDAEAYAQWLALEAEKPLGMLPRTMICAPADGASAQRYM
ncbi:MAG: galactokinase, partial [Myxococcota bacterium]